MPLAELPHTVSPYIALMVLGFGVGVLGHLFRIRLVVGIGIAMVFVATLLMPLILITTEDEPPSQPGIYAPGTR